MKKIIFYAFALAFLSIGCGGNRSENTDGNDTTDYNYRNGRSTLDSAARDSVDSMLLPTPPPTTTPET